MGISETVLHFVIYEKLKEKILSRSVNARGVGVESDKSPLDFAEFMIAGGMSKTLACITFYPHEVARTRMREEGDKYRRFWQTLSRVVVESGWRGLYGGLSAQLLRAVPNTALILLTYELTVYTLTPHSNRHGE
ncbi:hypothetical protein EB796_006141 [Bugula neritina]|uniref:Uncharacterized protein n=1 Tax=Bugula neritina TaxID=10212 RepID=A0A7J7KD65_BUGNE|nr:hypothetical protein EB796_006141 [Bugula neritina]